MISRDDIEAAARRIAGHVRRTPVIEIAPRLWLKLELLQHTGTFKPRGMFNRVLSNDVPPEGLIVASGGNAGLATAYVGQQLGHKVEVFVPVTTPTVKVQRLEEYGAVVVKTGEVYADALEASEERRIETGALQVHAYDQPEVVTGQGTLGRELAEQVPSADTVVVSVGGGGLIAGIGAWYAGTRRVIAVESRGCPTMHDARAAGRPVEVAATGVAKDSLGAACIGDIAWSHLQAGHIGDCVLVDDADILSARRWLWQELRIVTEPGTAAAVAALRTGAYRTAADETVVVVLCGANTDPADLAAEL
ncbi:MAG TPA: threonine/serine dehydratase [Mycobacteriales bacterium]|nr:threonine/serine dehydratase [Mycobacteriales bacterium]